MDLDVSMKRGSILLLLALFVVFPVRLVSAQQPVKIPRIGYAGAGSASVRLEPLRQV
jgi:hypothetical protein